VEHFISHQCSGKEGWPKAISIIPTTDVHIMVADTGWYTLDTNIASDP
jgi:hypothetical protein